MVNEMICKFGEGEELPLLNYKRVEQIKSFLCHLSMIFEVFGPFL